MFESLDREEARSVLVAWHCLTLRSPITRDKVVGLIAKCELRFWELRLKRIARETLIKYPYY